MKSTLHLELLPRSAPSPGPAAGIRGCNGDRSSNGDRAAMGTGAAQQLQAPIPMGVSLSIPINPLPWMRPTRRGREGSPRASVRSGVLDGTHGSATPSCGAASGRQRAARVTSSPASVGIAGGTSGPGTAPGGRAERCHAWCALLEEGSGPPVRARGGQCGAGGRRAGRERGAVPCRAGRGAGAAVPARRRGRAQLLRRPSRGRVRARPPRIGGAGRSGAGRRGAGGSSAGAGAGAGGTMAR